MGKLNKYLNHLEEYFGVLSLIIATVLIFVQVVLRYVFNYSIIWSEEMARYLIIWFIFIGSSIAVRERAHAKVDVLVAYVPPLYKRILSILASAMAIVFCILIIVAGWQAIETVTQYSNFTPALGIPMYIPYLALPVGAALMIIRFSQLIWEDIQGFRDEPGGNHEQGGEKL
ncbi:TRAP transporter small permease [Salsuginibacillus kocurii]|uniref:TRAP transporter small permease n=1 Tax=Salsuginibacillus kocurii TaxID=427078 RepID=UPI0003692229|nr:TRAP transporter small permease [Salsuginibacillus kocurii]